MKLACYGKLPAHGDFVRHNVSMATLRIWDDWLEEICGVIKRRDDTKDRDFWCHLPCWYFYISPGTVGPKAIEGIWMASWDAEGRYFPFTIFSEHRLGSLTPVFIPIDRTSETLKTNNISLDVDSTKCAPIHQNSRDLWVNVAKLAQIALKNRLTLEQIRQSLLEYSVMSVMPAKAPWYKRLSLKKTGSQNNASVWVSVSELNSSAPIEIISTPVSNMIDHLDEHNTEEKKALAFRFKALPDPERFLQMCWHQQNLAS